MVKRALEELHRPEALGRERAGERERRAALERHGLPHALAARRAVVAAARIQAQPCFIEKVKPAGVEVLGHGFDKVLVLGHDAGCVTLLSG